MSEPRCLPAGVQDGDSDVEDEEQDQETLRRQIILRPVAQHAPGSADGERKHEAQQVEQAPRTFERDDDNAGIEQGVI